MLSRSVRARQLLRLLCFSAWYPKSQMKSEFEKVLNAYAEEYCTCGWRG